MLQNNWKISSSITTGNSSKSTWKHKQLN